MGPCYCCLHCCCCCCSCRLLASSLGSCSAVNTLCFGPSKSRTVLLGQDSAVVLECHVFSLKGFHAGLVLPHPAHLCSATRAFSSCLHSVFQHLVRMSSRYGSREDHNIPGVVAVQYWNMSLLSWSAVYVMELY